jgi:hypothetical protein
VERSGRRKVSIKIIMEAERKEGSEIGGFIAISCFGFVNESQLYQVFSVLSGKVHHAVSTNCQVYARTVAHK